jgi:hypothetical protein
VCVDWAGLFKPQLLLKGVGKKGPPSLKGLTDAVSWPVVCGCACSFGSIDVAVWLERSLVGLQVSCCLGTCMPSVC